MISIVVATDLKGMIGANNGIPWNMPSDRKRFKALTKGHKVIMGRKTYESLPEDSRPLPDRENIVISHDWVSNDDITVVRSWEEAFSRVPGREEGFVIGGGEIYRQAIKFASRIYLTEVQVVLPGDTFFPDIKDAWYCSESNAVTRGDGDEYSSRYRVFKRGS